MFHSLLSKVCALELTTLIHIPHSNAIRTVSMFFLSASFSSSFLVQEFPNSLKYSNTRPKPAYQLKYYDISSLLLLIKDLSKPYLTWLKQQTKKCQWCVPIVKWGAVSNRFTGSLTLINPHSSKIMITATEFQLKITTACLFKKPVQQVYTSHHQTPPSSCPTACLQRPFTVWLGCCVVSGLHWKQLGC